MQNGKHLCLEKLMLRKDQFGYRLGNRLEDRKWFGETVYHCNPESDDDGSQRSGLKWTLNLCSDSLWFFNMATYTHYMHCNVVCFASNGLHLLLSLKDFPWLLETLCPQAQGAQSACKFTTVSHGIPEPLFNRCRNIKNQHVICILQLP